MVLETDAQTARGGEDGIELRALWRVRAVRTGPGAAVLSRFDRRQVGLESHARVIAIAVEQRRREAHRRWEPASLVGEIVRRARPDGAVGGPVEVAVGARAAVDLDPRGQRGWRAVAILVVGVGASWIRGSWDAVADERAEITRA